MLLTDRSESSNFPGLLASSPEPRFLSSIYCLFPYCFFILHPQQKIISYIFFFLRTCLHCSEAQDWSRLAVRKLGNGICINPTHLSFTCLGADSGGRVLSINTKSLKLKSRGHVGLLWHFRGTFASRLKSRGLLWKQNKRSNVLRAQTFSAHKLESLSNSD